MKEVIIKISEKTINKAVTVFIYGLVVWKLIDIFVWIINPLLG